MTEGTKSMIAGCIDRMAANDCGDCVRRDACADLFANLFGNREPLPRRRPTAARQRGFGSLFLNLLGEVARNVERNVEARQQAARRAEAPARPSRAKPTTAGAESAGRAAAPKAGAEPGPFQREVETHLEPLLTSGPLGIDSVARDLGYSRQTLYRRLKAEGVTYEEVLDRLRRRLALRLLREEGLSVKETAWRLGFSDPAAFSRAFKRWTGASPTAGRRDN